MEHNTRMLIGGPLHGVHFGPNYTELVFYLNIDSGPLETKYHLFEESEFGSVYVYQKLLRTFYANHYEAYGIPPVPAPETRLTMSSQSALF